MLDYVRAQGVSAHVSLEIEKPRAEIESLFSYPDLLMFSREYAQHCGCEAGLDFLQQMHAYAPQADLVCTLGAAGAVGLATTGSPYRARGYPPEHLVDTLGAGDTFNAGVIHARVQGRGLAEALDFACRLAGKKCGQLGLHDLFDG